MRRIDLPIILIGLLSVTGGLAVLYSTPWGIGVSTDSVTYLMAARNLLAGNGLSLWAGNLNLQPLTHFPPFYPLLLAGMASLGIDPLVGARGLGAVLFAANIASIGIILRRCATGSPWTAVIGAFLATSAPFMLELHSMLWTEPLFIFLGLWGLVILSQHLRQPRLATLIGSALLVGLAWLDRYIGIALVFTGLVGLLWLGRKPFRGRLLDGLAFALLSSLPVVIWLVRNELVAGKGTDRQWAVHPLSLAQLKTALLVFSTWLVPQGLSNLGRQALLLLVALLILGLGAYLWRRRQLDKLDGHPVFLPFTFIGVYLAFLGLSISFLDAQIPLESRLLSPLWVAGCLAALYLVDWLAFRVQAGWTVKLIALGSLLVVCGLYLQNGLYRVVQIRRQGLGYASPVWIGSDLVARVRLLPQDAPLYTNAPEVIYFFTGRRASPLPYIYNPNSLLPNPAFEHDIQGMQAELSAERGALVFFNALKDRSYFPSEEQLKAEMPLRLWSIAQDGTIYTLQNGP